MGKERMGRYANTRRTWLLILGAAALLVTTLMAGTSGGSAQSSTSWPTFHGNATRNGVSSASGPTAKTATNEWILATFIDSSPVVDASGTGYVGNDDGNLYAFSPSASASWIWRTSVGGAIKAAPTLSPDAGKIYVDSANGAVTAISTSTHGVLWQKSLGVSPTASPLLSNDGSLVYVSAGSNIYALHTSDGSTAWSAAPGGVIVGSLALSPDGSALWAASVSNAVYSVSASSGQSPVVYYLDGPALAGPSVDSSGNVYVGTAVGTFTSFSYGSPSPRWSFSTGLSAVTTTAALFNGLAIFGAANGNLYAVQQSNGSSAWSFHTGGAISSAPAVASGNSLIYFNSDDGNLYAVNGSGSQSWSRNIASSGPSSPAVASDGSVWSASHSGPVYRIHQITPPATFPPTSAPAATSTPGPTSQPTAAPTATATTQPTAATLLRLSVTGKVSPGSKETARATYTPNTSLTFTVTFPNGDKQTATKKTNGSGVATYSFKESASKIRHNSRSARVTAAASGGTPSISSSFTINFGKIDVSVEPRSQKRGKGLDIWVHTSKNTKVDISVSYANGTDKLTGKTGSNGWADRKYTVWKKGNPNRSGNVIVTARQHAHTNVSTGSSFKISK